MAASAKRRRVRFRLIILILILIGLGIGVYFIINPSTGRLKSSAIESQMEVSAIIIRNETVVQRSANAYNIHFLADDGDYVKSGEPIANVYERGYDRQLDEIISLQQQIYRQQLSLISLQYGEGGIPSELTQINTQIDQKISELAAISKGESNADYVALYTELDGLLTQRMSILSQLVTADEALNNSLNTLSTLQAAFTVKSTIVNDSSDGYISFNLDGYENVLNPEQLNTTQISDLISSNGLVSSAANDMYRIVAPNTWYVAFNVPVDSPERLIQGQTYTISQKGSELSYQAFCKSMRIFSTKITFVLEINADVKPVLETRSAAFVITRVAQGASAPLDAFTYVEGVPTLSIKQQGGGYIPIAVNILASDEKRAIVQAQDSTIELREGLKYDIP